MALDSGLVRCVFGDPLSKQNGRKYAAVGWYGKTRAYGDSRLAVRLGYTFSRAAICGLPVPCTLESLAGCGFCLQIEVCELGLSHQRAVQCMIAMDTPEGLDSCIQATEQTDRWAVYSTREYDPTCEATLFSDPGYREEYKRSCVPQPLIRAFRAALATVNARCNYVYLGDVASLVGARGNEGASLQLVLADTSRPLYSAMSRSQLEHELAELGDEDHDRCLKHYICQLLSATP